MDETKLSLHERTQALGARVKRGKREEKALIRWIPTILRAVAAVVEAEIARKRGPGLSKSGEYPSIIDLEESPNSGSWRVA